MDADAIGFRTFGLMLLLTVALYGFLHVRSAGWVFEDTTWRNGGAKHVGDMQWELYQMPSIWTMVTSIPNRHLTAWTFYLTPDDPRVAHGINVAVHVVNALLLALLMNRLGAPGWAMGVIFLILPLASQAVAYASGRAELLSALSVLGACWFALVSRWRVWLRWTALLGILVLGSMTKPTFAAIVIPLVLWLDWFYGRETLDWLWESAFFVGLPALAWLIWHILTRPQLVVSTVPLWRWIGIQCGAAWMLLAASVLPLHLSIDHAWWTMPDSVQIVAIGVTLFIAAVLIDEALAKPASYATLGIGWFWIAILPRLLVRETQGWMREHHIYVSLLGIAMALGGWLGTKQETHGPHTAS